MSEITGYSTRIVGNPWKNWFFLKLESTSGVHGIGEASLNGFVQTVSTAVSELEDFFVGQSAFDVNKIVHDMTYSVYSDGGQIHRAAIAAIEAACWDIIGKNVGQPVWNLWGGKIRDDIRLYANGWYQTKRDPEAFAQKAVIPTNMGYTALKFDPFGSATGPRVARWR